MIASRYWGRSNRNEAHCVVVPTREAASLHSTKGSGKTCRVAFLGNGVFIRGATLDVELRLDALPAFRENSALQTLENINGLLAPLLTHHTEDAQINTAHASSTPGRPCVLPRRVAVRGHNSWRRCTTLRARAGAAGHGQDADPGSVCCFIT